MGQRRSKALYVLGKLADASPADLWRWALGYRNLAAHLAAPPRTTPVEMVTALFPDVPAASAEECQLEFLHDNEFWNALNGKMADKRRCHVGHADWHDFLYMAVRFLKPRVVFETGVFDGQSSAIILSALARNGQGELVSIDLPAVTAIGGSTDGMNNMTLPPNCQPGWAVPERLREHYHLELGDSRQLLPQLLKRYSTIDIFFHDSLHTFEHMYFEFNTAWPHLTEGGLLLSDDIFWNPALHRFCKEKHTRYLRLERFGAVRKPKV
jgi:predicted O-methyltransferase YrrM